MRQTVYTRAVLRACEIAGGVEALSTRIQVSQGVIRAWLRGSFVPPPAYFLRVTDLIDEATYASGAQECLAL